MSIFAISLFPLPTLRGLFPLAIGLLTVIFPNFCCCAYYIYWRDWENCPIGRHCPKLLEEGLSLRHKFCELWAFPVGLFTWCVSHCFRDTAMSGEYNADNHNVTAWCGIALALATSCTISDEPLLIGEDKFWPPLPTTAATFINRSSWNSNLRNTFGRSHILYTSTMSAVLNALCRGMIPSSRDL